MMADSRATTGVPLRRASWTSSAITNSSGWVSPRLTPSANPLVTLLPVLRPVNWSFSLRCALLTMMDSSEVCCGQKGFHDNRIELRSGAPRYFRGSHVGLRTCLLYTSDAADDLLCVDLGGRRIIK